MREQIANLPYKSFGNISLFTLGFPYSSAGKESSCNAGDLDSIPGLGRSPEEAKGYPLQYSDMENFVDYIYSSWGHKESDTTEQISLSLSLFTLHNQ